MRNTALLFVLIFASLQAIGAAQEELRKEADIKADIDASTVKLKKYCHAMMDLHLSQLETIAKADAKAIRKLKIAAKGHIAALVRKQHHAWLEGYAAIRAADPNDDEAFMKAASKYYRGGGMNQQPQRMPKWRAILKKVLSQEQIAKMEAERDRRLNRHRDALIMQLTGMLDDILYFSDEERTKAFKVLQSSLNRKAVPEDDRLDSAMYHFSDDISGGFIEDEDDPDVQKRADQRVEQINAGMKKILDEERFETWKETCQEAFRIP